MKKICLMLSCPIMLFLLQCAGSMKSDSVLIECRNKCETTFQGCFKKAAKNRAKRAACEAVKNKCLSDCEKK